MSHALLLRLFLSPSFFSVHVALQYLRHYSDNIGITYYITRRLREVDVDDLRDVWGFICHLLVTRPSKSRALECFVVETCQKSTHIAMLTLWFMQAYLKDLSVSSRHDAKTFSLCQTVLHRCHELIFADLPPPATSPYSTLSLTSGIRFGRKKIKAHVEPAVVGMGLIAAACPALPKLASTMGEVVIEQGRVDDNGRYMRSVEPDEDDFTISIGSTHSTYDEEDDDEEDESDAGFERRDQIIDLTSEAGSSRRVPDFRKTADMRRSFSGQGSSSIRRQTIAASQTSPALPLHLQTSDRRRSRLSDDPLDQDDPPSPVRASTTPFQSSPLISLSRSPSSATYDRAHSLLQRYDAQAQIYMLRSQYCRSEVQFLLSLEDISNRLLIVPKPARVSALRAELTTLNHKLPAEVCMPMWCTSSDAPTSNGGTQPHHRIVRIPPGESVVLNSAERAPYLLLIEILNGDLDFDPTKRNNKEILKKMVVKEEERQGASKDLVMFRSPVPGRPQHRRKLTSDSFKSGDMVLGKELVDEPEEPKDSPALGFAIPPTPTSADSPLEDEEVDLVEQLYGPDNSLRSRGVDLSESIVLPLPPKNKDLDMAAWSRSSSVPPSPAVDSAPPSFESAVISPPPPSATGGGPVRQDSLPGSLDGGRVLSLDEYSERMRTAAVMLAQLNISLVAREPTASGAGIPSASDPSSSKPLSWLVPNGWLSVVAAPQNGHGNGNGQGPVHPSLAGVPTGGGSHSSSAPASGMKLQPAEAAAIRDRIMKEMIALEEERMERMRENREGEGTMRIGDASVGMKTAEDESIIRRELNKADPSAVVFSESWAAKKSRIRHASPYGHLASWDCVSVIVKTGGDLRQEQLAIQLIREFQRIWQEENCQCWVRYFRILVTGGNSGLVETITDAVSIHSIKKAEYARRLTEGRLGYVTLLDHFVSTYGDPSSAKFARAQRNFAKSLAGYSLVTYLLQIKDRHNGNILLDREGHLIHIDFGFMLSNSPGNIGFEAAPFKLPLEYLEVLGGIESEPFKEFRRLFREGFEAARKHCDRIINIVELMQKDSNLPCFAALGEQTANQLRDRFQPALTHSLVGEVVDRLIDTSLGSNWTRLYDSYQYYAQSIL